MRLPRSLNQTFDRLVTLAVILFVLAVIWLLAGCNQQFGSTKPKKQSFVVVLHNGDVGYPASMSVSWWRESTVVGTTWREVPGGGETTLVMGDMPDGFMIEVVGWSSAPNTGLSFGSPDYATGKVFHVCYPSGAYWSEYAPR